MMQILKKTMYGLKRFLENKYMLQNNRKREDYIMYKVTGWIEKQDSD